MQKYGMGILGQTTGWVRCPEEDLGKQCPCQWDTRIDRLVNDKGFFTIFLNPREPPLKVPSAAGCTWRERVHRQPPHRQECQRKRHRCGAWACTTSTTSCCPGWARSRVRTHARPCSCANGCTGTSTSPCQAFGIVVMVALVPFTQQLGMPKCHSCDLPQLLLPITNIRKLGIGWINWTLDINCYRNLLSLASPSLRQPLELHLWHSNAHSSYIGPDQGSGWSCLCTSSSQRAQERCHLRTSSNAELLLPWVWSWEKQRSFVDLSSTQTEADRRSMLRAK